MVLAATNFPWLDEAVLEKRIYIGLPDANGRVYGTPIGCALSQIQIQREKQWGKVLAERKENNRKVFAPFIFIFEILNHSFFIF